MIFNSLQLFKHPLSFVIAAKDLAAFRLGARARNPLALMIGRSCKLFCNLAVERLCTSDTNLSQCNLIWHCTQIFDYQAASIILTNL